MNAEFQRIARRDKKAFLSDQCKEVQENNKMGKNRDLFKKIRDTKGTFHAKMGKIKGRGFLGGNKLLKSFKLGSHMSRYTHFRKFTLATV